MTGVRALLIEDDAKTARALAIGLRGEGFEPMTAKTGEEGFFLLSRESFDVVILDWMLPGRDGIEVLRTLRAGGSKTPVLLLTARDAVEDRVLGLNAGADDYLVKPFAFAELLARIRALLRRVDSGNALRQQIGDLTLNIQTRRVARRAREIALTPREFDLLTFLAQHHDQTVTRQMIAREVWREPNRATPLDNVIDVHLAHLRRKVDDGESVKGWWERRSVRFRLALWYAAATALVLIAFAWFVYEVIEHRLAAEIDRQLRIDFDLIEAQLDIDTEGGVHWTVRGSHGDEGFARMSAWFEVWSENRELLLRHWPVPEANIKDALPPPQTSTLNFATVELERGLFLRVMERPGRVHGRSVIIRVFRDETEMRRTLREIVEVSVLGFPLAGALAAIGGYLVATRSLAPLDAMARQARRITSESLSERLPNPNPNDELGRLATVFNETLTRLESSFAELQRFTSDASHELRSPLTALCAVGEVALRDGHDPAMLRETIGSMLEEAQRLTDLVDALLTLARMDATKAGAAREEVNIAELLEEIRDQFEVLAAEKGQTFAVNCDHNVSVQADRTLLRLALVNLVHNAIQHSPSSSKISLAAARRPSRVDISVIDSGHGIAPEYHEKIFERFFRVDKARSRSGGGGVGLGLAIARRAVERNGGRIFVESDSDRGSVFRIELPSSGELAGSPATNV